MKQILKKIFVVLFFVICIVPIACMPFASSDLAENRSLSEFPTWVDEEGVWNKDFFNELQDYVAEHFAFRGQLVELDGKIKYRINSPSNDQVVLGKDGWMFFDRTLNDYGGVTLGEDKISQIADTLEEVYAYIEAQGKTPLLLIAPNKNSIYPEYMPARFGQKANMTNLSLLQNELKKRNMQYIDAQKILSDGKSIDEMYLHYDTHWNDTGARLVMNSVYKELGLDDQYELTGYELEKVHEPDLYSMLFPTDGFLETQHVYPDKEQNYKYVGRMRSLDDLTIKTASDNGNGSSILVFRDSFGRAMIPYMGGVFDTCVFNRSTPYDLSMVDNTECDFVLIEIVERNIVDLGDIVVD